MVAKIGASGLTIDGKIIDTKYPRNLGDLAINGGPTFSDTTGTLANIGPYGGRFYVSVEFMANSASTPVKIGFKNTGDTNTFSYDGTVTNITNGSVGSAVFTTTDGIPLDSTTHNATWLWTGTMTIDRLWNNTSYIATWRMSANDQSGSNRISYGAAKITSTSLINRVVFYSNNGYASIYSYK